MKCPIVLPTFSSANLSATVRCLTAQAALALTLLPSIPVWAQPLNVPEPGAISETLPPENAQSPVFSQHFRFRIVLHPQTLPGQPGLVLSAVPTVSADWLEQALKQADSTNLAFVVINGVKAESERCDDALISRRVHQLAAAKNGVFISLAASDWTRCRTPIGTEDDIEFLSRLRDALFDSNHSFGDTALPLIRQGTSPKFHSYVENTRWDIGKMIFATIHAPSDNNHYLSAGGRNGEFEDRTIANRAWLKRLFAFARINHAEALVLFSDGDLWTVPPSHFFSLRKRRDGYQELRSDIRELAADFKGKVLLLSQKTASRNSDADKGSAHPRAVSEKEIPLSWNKNIASASLSAADPRLGGYIDVEVDAGDNSKPASFRLLHQDRTSLP